MSGGEYSRTTKVRTYRTCCTQNPPYFVPVSDCAETLCFPHELCTPPILLLNRWVYDLRDVVRMPRSGEGRREKDSVGGARIDNVWLSCYLATIVWSGTLCFYTVLREIFTYIYTREASISLSKVPR
ncbi:hypothetical protein EV356DRAFT_325480 [Viridothelium virens]|uniref:Uncharacterized protein n=1 Tax=Viridothelium virens TaxID=1048519 RepID=A0A6A6GYJ4_VIRVR|nr:hypothetical protein EV356DRAFT_325480 [Viridothelium virens]